MLSARRKQRQAVQSQYYNRGARKLQPLETGDRVHIRTKSKTWKPATVLKKENTPRSYAVRTNDRGEYCRNRRFLVKTPSGSLQQPDVSRVQERDNVGGKQVDSERTAPSTSAETTGDERIQEAADGLCKTRFGRSVKPPERLDLSTVLFMSIQKLRI